MEFCEKLQELRKNRGMTQEELAAKLQLNGCDITRSAVAKIEVGQRHIYPDEILAIKAALRVTFDKIFDIKKVINIPNKIIPSNIKTPYTEDNKPPVVPTKNIVIIDISIGNLPLQGIKEFVIIAISLSRGESIILHPVTPQALHPIPIAIVRHCLP